MVVYDSRPFECPRIVEQARAFAPASTRMETLAIFLAVGAVSGVMAGLFGVGGGLIMVPALALLLPRQGLPGDIYMQVAIGTSLAVIGFTSLSSTRAHHRRGGVRWDVVLRFAPGLVIGALAGGLLADLLGGEALKRIVGVGALLVAAQMLRPPKPVVVRTTLPGPGELLAAGAGIGVASALVGIGGGSLTVPYLSARGLPIHQAIGSAAACGVPIAWAGALGFVAAGWHAGLPAGYLGYVDLRAVASLAVASVLFAPLGARLAHALPPLALKRAFAVLLAVIGTKMLLG
jgi:uncharacterized membrane protein YfcA